jgi:hypothetical protein
MDTAFCVCVLRRTNQTVIAQVQYSTLYKVESVCERVCECVCERECVSECVCVRERESVCERERDRVCVRERVGR